MDGEARQDLVVSVAVADGALVVLGLDLVVRSRAVRVRVCSAIVAEKQTQVVVSCDSELEYEYDLNVFFFFKMAYVIDRLGRGSQVAQ